MTRPAIRLAVWSLVLTCVSIAAAQQVFVTPNAPLLGSAWYPEQWPESYWEHDLALMEQAHMTVVRIGEFAWSTLEPAEGKFEFNWMNRAIAAAARHHLKVVIGTPTDAPPAWLTTHYPDTLGMNADGHWREHGGRRQFNYASPRYREFCRRIVAAMAQRFGHNPAVIGWQIGNEYTDESFDPQTKKQFQDFLRAHYGSLDSLNTHWATAYWSQTYTDWSQIPLHAVRGNPGLLLEHKHFITATWRSFQREQIESLRSRIAASQFITTNIGGLAWSDNWDHYAIAADLDIASWDDYVGQGHLQVERNAMLNDFVRGWRRQTFWVMETQPGSVNWAAVNNTLVRGETRALAWQTIGHGADALLYWQWRSALNGQEQYHGAIVGADNQPLPLYAEVAQLGREFEQASDALRGTSPDSEIAILHAYDSRWAIDFQPHTERYDQQQVLLEFYTPLSRYAQSSGHQVDIIDPTQDGPLTPYKLLVAPSLNVIPDELARRLTAWVQAGGHLFLGPRSGMKDKYNALAPERQPGPLVSALGAKVEQYYALAKSVAIESGEGNGTADVWAEDLMPIAPDVEINLRYGKTDGGWLDGRPAMVTRALGKGSISYLGTLPDAATMQRILRQAASNAAVSPPVYALPDGVELCARTSLLTRESTFILINHGAAVATVNLTARLAAVTGDGILQGNSITLPPQGVEVLSTRPGLNQP